MSIIVLDTETTGLDSSVDKLVELAAVSTDRNYSDFSTLINPGRDIPPEVRAIHHICPEDVVGKPMPAEALQRMHEHFELENTPRPIFCAHNAKFDQGFLEAIVPMSVDWICTYKCAVMLWPDAPAHGNQVLRYWLGLSLAHLLPPELFPHRALYDCIVTRAILQEMLQLKPVEQLLAWSSGPILLPKVSFGKHKGMAWADVPYGYLKWCVGQSDMNEDVRYTAEHWLRRWRR